MSPTKTPRLVKPDWRDGVESRHVEVIKPSSYLPVNTTTNRSPICFSISGVPNLVTDFKNAFLVFTYTVQKWDKTAEIPGWVAVKKSDLIAPVNSMGSSMFQNLDVYINGSLAETSQNNYSIVSHFKNVFFTTPTEKRSLEAAQYYPDQPGAHDLVSKSLAKVEISQRAEAIEYEQAVQLVTPIYSDILSSMAYWPDNVNISLRFYPTRTFNCLQSMVTTDDCNVIINEAALHVPRLKCKTALPRSLSCNFETFKTMTFIHGKSLTNFSQSLVAGGQLPSRLAVIMLSEKRYNGSPEQTPLLWHHMDVKRAALKVNGITNPTTEGIVTDFDKNQFFTAYKALFDSLGAIDVPFPANGFNNGFTVFSFSLTPDNDKKRVTGSCELNLDFNKAPETNIVVMCLCMYSSTFTVSNAEFTTDMPKL